VTEEQLRRYRRESIARSRHTQQYWRNHDKDSYTCPDCGRGRAQVATLHVHHRDHDPTNGDPENLVALCERCHLQRHGKERHHRSVAEWKHEFLGLGQVDPADKPYVANSEPVATDGGEPQ